MSLPSAQTAVHDTPPFVRDRPTVLTYSALGAYAFWLYAFGPAVALLRTELHFSYTVIGGYSAAWAAGSVLAGVTFPALAARLGRRGLLWGSAAVTTGGAALFTFTRSIVWTMAGAVVMGLAGTLLQATTQSALSDRHGERRDQALIESNIGAAACAVLAPLALGGLHGTAATWRTAMAVPAVVLVGLYLTSGRVRLPEAAAPADGAARRAGRLSPACWSLCLLVAVGIGVEFALIYFAAELLVATTGLTAADAATSVTVFYAGLLIGRVAGGRLARRRGRAPALLWTSLAVTFVGLLALWLTAQPAVALAGLFLAGVGIANQFPLSLALALEAADGHTDTANARAQLLGAVLVLTAPFLLGVLADRTGLATAFAVPVLLTAACCLLLYLGTAPRPGPRRRARLR